MSNSSGNAAPPTPLPSAIAVPPPDGRRLTHPSYATVAAGRQIPSSRSTTDSRSSSNPTSASDSREQLVPPSRNMDVDSHARLRPGTNGSARWASEHGSRGGDWPGCSTHGEHPPFVTPSYLKHSRHVQRVRQAWEAHVAELAENATKAVGSGRPPLSNSSSSLNLNKLPNPHVHRGVAQDVIERIPAPSSTSLDDPLHPLPSRWSEHDVMNGLDILADGTEVRCDSVTKTGSDEAAAAVRSDFAMPKECGIYYFEVTILSRGKDGLIGVGFSGRKASLARLPGWESESWAYHGDDGNVFASSSNGKPYGPRFAAQDVIGCGVNFRTGNAFFTKNGDYLGPAFTSIKSSDRLYPSVGMKKPGEHLRVNFGKLPFVFDIDSLVDEERKTIAAEIRNADVSSLHHPDGEKALRHNLIAQYLAHEGYVDTAKAFSRDVAARLSRLSEGETPLLPMSSDEDDIHAINRQKIRKSILDGDIDRALKYTSSYYAHVLSDERNHDVYFRLRCRKFIEMMRKHAESEGNTSIAPTPESAGRDGHLNGAAQFDDDDDDENEEDMSEDPPSTQMELDEQLHRESLEPTLSAGDIDMSDDLPKGPRRARYRSPPSGAHKYKHSDDLIAAALEYGQGLRLDFGADQRPATQKFLREIFALVAYSSVSDSPVSHLFDPAGRVVIAEEVNGAILVSLGKPSSAALEKVCAQTEALLEEATLKNGGAASMVNVTMDFLRA